MSSTHDDRPAAKAPPRVWGIVAEFKSPHDLIEGVKAVRKAGFSRIDTHTPFPVHGMDRAMGLPPTRLPWLVLGGALTGTLCAFALQYWMNVMDYPYLVGGKPVFSYHSYVPVGFELTVLLGAFTTVLALLAMCYLPRPYHPLFTHPRFARATDDGFILSIEAGDPRWSEERARKVLAEAGGCEITVIREGAEASTHG